MRIDLSDPLLIDALVVLGMIVCWLACLAVEKLSKTAVAEAVRVVRVGIVPALGAWTIVKLTLHVPPDSSLVKALESWVGIAIVWGAASALKATVYLHPASESIRARTPRLLVDIVRFSFVVIGGMLIVAGIWKKDLTPILTTFGVGSLVLGLALQDTLGNLFAGLSLVLERPFAVGDWIQIGDVIGKVQQINWRATRVVTRELNEIVVPNSTLTKDRIVNFYRPSRAHGVRVTIGFSYDIAPNRVKDILYGVAFSTHGILVSPAPDVRVTNFAAYAVEYEVLFFIGDYQDLNKIRNEFMTQVWYAAKRNKLVIPYPISTVFKTEVLVEPGSGEPKYDTASFVRKIELFNDLSDEDCELLAKQAVVERFANDEAVVRQGDEGDSLFVIMDGKCTVSVKTADERPVHVTDLKPGDVFGEMSLIAGESRTATVQAVGDVMVARIGKGAITPLLDSRPEILQRFVDYAAQRAAGRERAIAESSDSTEEHRAEIDQKALLMRIRKFFGM